MLFVIAGPSYVGKKAAIAHFMKLYSFSSVIPYTTKPYQHRVGETEGIQYHYVEESSRNDIENESFIYDEPFNFGEYQEKTLYAYKKSDIQKAIESDSNFIVHASVGNVETMHREFSKYHENPNKNDTSWLQQIYFIFLNFSSPLTEEFYKRKQSYEQGGREEKTLPEIKSRLKNNHKNIRANETAKEDSIIRSDDFRRRFSHSQKEIQFYNANKNIFDATVASDKKYEICTLLESVILPKLRIMPTSPDKIPGPLSNMDIIYMCEKRKHDPLEIDIGGKKASSDEIEELLCGSGMHISLSNHIRKTNRKVRSSFIDMADDAVDLELLLSKIYPDEVINKGYILRPYEVILCSSNESVKLPHDVYAMVVSKFSYTQLGLSIELSPNIIQSGHNGTIHFQIKNNTNHYICIYPNIQVAQLLFFRTVQPSTKVYYEDENCAYDRDNTPPLPRFRQGNMALDHVKKPKAGFLKYIYSKLKENVMAEIVGIIVLVIGCILGGDELVEIVKNNIIPRLSNLSLAAYVVLFALVCCIANTAVFIIGCCCLRIGNGVIRFIHKRRREEQK